MKIIFGMTARFWASMGMVALLAGCAAAGVAISKKDLDVQSKTSTAIFVDPIAKNLRTVYVEIRSGVEEFDRRSFTSYLRKEFAGNENGYRIVDEPDRAHYHLSIYVLNLEKTSPTAAQVALQQGYSSGAQEAQMAGSAGALVGLRSGSGRGSSVMAGGLIGSALASGGALVANSMVQDVTFMLVADIAIKERVAAGVLVRRDTAINAQVSNSGTSRQTVSEATDRKEYRTRVVTTANKANLKLEEAQERMFSKTAYALAGFF